MNFEYLNQMVKYIEENLTRNIEYKKLAKIVGVSEYNLQRIFVFLTNVKTSSCLFVSFFSSFMIISPFLNVYYTILFTLCQTYV